MSIAALLTIYCSLILIASLVGGWVPFAVRLTHKRMELAASFVAGAMLGVGLLLLLPHAFHARLEAQPHLHSEIGHSHGDSHALLNPVILWLLAGFLVMFLIERFFCFHHHDPPQPPHSPQDRSTSHRHHVTWVGAGVGLSIHSLIDGVALAASVEMARQHGEAGMLAGVGTFIAILLHKPFDSLTLGTLMAIGDRPSPLRHLVNAGFAMLIPLGVALFYLGLSGSDQSWTYLSAALAFSAGTFLCISMSDLLPELQFHQHDRVKLTLAMLIGLALAWLVAFLEGQMH